MRFSHAIGTIQILAIIGRLLRPLRMKQPECITIEINCKNFFVTRLQDSCDFVGFCDLNIPNNLYYSTFHQIYLVIRKKPHFKLFPWEINKT